MIYIFLFICVIIVLIFFIYINFNLLQVSKYDIRDKKIPYEFDNYKILHLSDLHLKEFGKNNIKLLKKIDQINPNVIFITGDMIYKRESGFEVVYKLIKNLTKEYKVYYVLGNHEIALRYNKLKEFNQNLRNLGVNLLLDSKVNINKNGYNIVIYGINFKFNMEPKKVQDIKLEKYSKILKKQVGNIDTSKYNILLAHDPLNYELYDSFKFDLVFSGHVHGGALRLFGKAIFSPRRLLFPKYSAGVYNGKNGKMVVSRGLGSSTLKLRMFNFPEIVCVTLKCGNKKYFLWK